MALCNRRSGGKKVDPMKALVTIPLLLLWSLAALGQGTVATKKASPVHAKTHPQPPLKPATVSGYVFAVTKGGDIKPARMASVYMFYSRPVETPASQLVDQSPDGMNAADVFAREVVKGEERGKAKVQGKPYLRDSTICNTMLAEMYSGAIVATLDWGNTHQTQVVFGDTDEEGKFEITFPPDLKDATFEQGAPHDGVFAPGVYHIVVNGAAGYNNAVWETDVTVNPGDALKIKVSDPTKACVKLDTE
jgi:hypothetical protein